jgi:hypothetical protein
MEVAAVGREAGGLRFEQVQRGSKGEILSVVVRLRVPGLDAGRQIWAHYATGFDELVAFFNGWRLRLSACGARRAAVRSIPRTPLVTG